VKKAQNPIEPELRWASFLDSDRKSAAKKTTTKKSLVKTTTKKATKKAAE
jgi:hypothetical protein